MQSHNLCITLYYTAIISVYHAYLYLRFFISFLKKLQDRVGGVSSNKFKLIITISISFVNIYEQLILWYRFTILKFPPYPHDIRCDPVLQGSVIVTLLVIGSRKLIVFSNVVNEYIIYKCAAKLNNKLVYSRLTENNPYWYNATSGQTTHR